MNFINDTQFLNELFSLNEREIYVRITALNFKEQPLETIEGKAIDGSVNVDGASAVRRTCNITMVANDISLNEYYWGLKNKFKLEIGLKNLINLNYPDIIWFKQGIFVITQFNTTQDTKKWTIKIQGKDKMCLLNGDVSGNLPFNVDFAREEYYDVNTKMTTFKEIPIKTIIQKAICEFGGESLHNVIIKDIDNIGQAILEYRGVDPLYLFKDLESDEFKQVNLNKNLKCYYELPLEISLENYNDLILEYNFFERIYEYSSIGTYRFNKNVADNNEEYLSKNHNGWFEGKVSDKFFIIYDDLLDDIEFSGNSNATIVRFNLNEKFNNKRYSVAKIEYGDIPGYKLVELTYGGELKGAIGESITSILDKIKRKFANFEYFYDIDGKFIFQKKANYLSTSWNTNDENNQIISISNNPEVLFTFTDNKLISSFQNNPKLTNLKNDYSVWGSKDKTTMHMRFAIDSKPQQYLPIRPLKEKIIQIFRDKDGKFVKEKIISKYFDAPEIEPYNDNGLYSNDQGYQFIKIMDKIIDYQQIPLDVYYNIEEILKTHPNDSLVSQWLKLFFREDKSYHYQYLGNQQNIKDIFLSFNSQKLLYDNHAETVIIQDDEYEVWNVSYLYYAKYPYSVKDVKDEEGNLVHYKVDWRELIYQMALDYRKLNYTDNFLYYLSQANPEFISGKTGYEQYYIDLEGFWRQLYNPNPEELFNNSISYSDIKNETLLLDDISDNDILDRIYIKNPYVKVTEDNIQAIEISNLYKYSTPKNQDSNRLVKNSLYSFVTSRDCCLSQSSDNDNNIYYIEKTDANGSPTMHPYSWDGQESDIEDYKTLNSINMNKIYVKNDESFESKHSIYQLPSLFQKNLFYIKVNDTYEITNDYPLDVTYYKYNADNDNYTSVFLPDSLENVYEKGKFYIRNNNEYILSFEPFNEDQIYYQLIYTISSDTGEIHEPFIDKLNNNFNALMYTAVSTLDTFKNEKIKDYILYQDKKFDELKSKMLDEDLLYYMKDSINMKLSDLKEQNAELWNLYYVSDFYPLSYYTSHYLSMLIKQHDKVDYNNLPELNIVEYSDFIFNTLYDYTVKIINKDFRDLKECLIDRFIFLFEEYKNTIINMLIDAERYPRNDSCLNYLAGSYKNNIMKLKPKININLNNLTEEELNYLLGIINDKYNFYGAQFVQQNGIYSFNGNNNDRIQLLKLIQSKLIKEYPLEEQLVEKINLMRNINLQLKNFVNNIQENYLQVQDVITYKETILKKETIEDLLEELIKLVDRLSLKEGFYEGQLKKTINALNGLILDIQNNTNDLETYQEQFSIIVSHVEALKLQRQAINAFTFIIFRADNTDAQYNILLDLLSKINKLYMILEQPVDSMDSIMTIQNLLLFNDWVLVQDLYNKLLEVLEPQSLSGLIKEFRENTSNFQEYIFKYPVDNFGYITDKNLIYEPIQYCRAYYAYNREKINGNFWNQNIYSNPHNLYFWFDFLEPSTSDLLKYSVPTIGSRIKVVNDREVKSVHYKDIPNIIFKLNTQSMDNLIGYTFVNITEGFSNLFSISSKSKTAKERIDELLLNHSYCTENVNLSVIPVYTLEPNNKIYIRDDKSNIDGQYLINKITIPLNHKKTMTISALKDIDNII